LLFGANIFKEKYSAMGMKQYEITLTFN